MIENSTKGIFITGASSGFGKAIAEKFAKEGYRLYLAARRYSRLESLKNDLENQYDARVEIFELDIRDKKAVGQLFQQLKKLNHTLDILVNNAGLAAGLAPIDEGDLEDWDRMIDTNIKGLLYVTKSALPILKSSPSPQIINIVSTAGKVTYKNGNVYSATKFDVDALNQSMRIDLLPFGIKVTAINPGMAETEFSEVRFHGDKKRAKAVYNDVQPLSAQDIAEVAWFAANQPPHVCLNDIVLTCLTQANSTQSIKNSERIQSID